MIENTQHKFLVVVLMVLLFANPYLSAQGLQFYGIKVPIEQRTSYALFDKEQAPVFSHYMDVEFDLRISQSDVFGYLFHIVNPQNNDAYSLTFSYVNDESSAFSFNTEGKVNHIAVSMPNDSIISQWLPVKLHVNLLTGESMLTIGNRMAKGTSNIAKLSQQIQPILKFGRREHLVDVPAFAIRRLKVSSEKESYTFLLNESSGNSAHDSKGEMQGSVINPYWLINDSYHWTTAVTFESSVCMGAKFNKKCQAIEFITPDSLFTYQVDVKLSQKRPYANRMPVKMQLGTNFINEMDGQMYAYEINNLPTDSTTIAALDLSTLLWKPLGKGYTKVQLHHHNGFWDKWRNRYMVFGGFGNRLYSNKFLTYNETNDRWDTLQFRGDDLPPRFYSSMTSTPQGNSLYIYGGVGNESGDQTIGHNYYNDLYEIDLDRNTIKQLWSHSLDEKRVPSEQMVLSEDGKSLYVIRYAEYIKSTSLQLYRISVADGKMEQLGDSIPFLSGSIASTVSLYYNSLLKEFYCVTQQFDEHAKRVKAVIYTLSDPPVSKAEIEYYQAEKEKYSWVMTIAYLSVSVLCVLLGWMIYSRILRRRRKIGRKHTSDIDSVSPKNYREKEEVSKTSANVGREPKVTMGDRKKEYNKIYVYGMFTVYDKAGHDITYLLSKKLKLIFLYILLNSSEKGEGVNSYALNEIFWPDKPEDKAKNLKGVTISNLRKVLAELDGVKLLYDKGIFKIAIDKDLCYCDYFSLHTSLVEHPQSCGIFLPIWERGKLLENIVYPLFDKYKQNSEDIILSLLPKDLAMYYRQGDYRYALRICFIILKRDPLNEQALSYCIRSYKKLNDFENLSKVYSAFIIEYRRSMGEDFGRTVEDILQELEVE